MYSSCSGMHILNKIEIYYDSLDGIKYSIYNVIAHSCTNVLFP